MIVKLLFGVFLLHLVGCKNLKNKKMSLPLERFARYACTTKECEEREAQKEKTFYEHFVKFNCYKFRMCIHNDVKVCGHDDHAGALTYFENECDLYYANCNRRGIYKIADIIVCDMRANYTVSNIDDLKFVKILTYTSRKPIVEDTTFGDKSVIRTGNLNNTSTDVSFANLKPLISGLPNSHCTYRLRTMR